MADTVVPPVVTEPVAEAAPTSDEAAAPVETAPSVEEPTAGNKRKFEEEAGKPDADEEERAHKRVVLEGDAGAATSAEGGDVTAAGGAVNTQPTAAETVEAAPAAAPAADAVAAPDTTANPAVDAAPDAAAATSAAPEAQQTSIDGQAATDGQADPAQQPAAGSVPDQAAVEAAQAAAAATASALAQNASGLEQMLQIPGSLVGKLIGKQGETIKGLQFTTGTRIQIDHATPGDMKNVTVTGSSAEQVQQAVNSINGLMSEASGPGAGDLSETVECPPGIVGRIIGRGGETIRGLQQASGAHIVVNQDFPEGVPRQITVTGKPDSVQRAVSMIHELIQGEPGSAQAIIQKFGAGVSRVLECPKGMVGRVIGKGGETIKALQKQFSVNIQIEQSSDPMTITIAGQPHTVDHAAAAVQEIINGGNPFGANAPPNFAGGAYGGAAAGYGAPGGYGGGYGGGFQAPPYQAPYAAPYGAPAAYGGYGAPAPAYGGYGGFPGGADPYAQQGGYGAAAGYGAAPAAAPAAAGVWQELPDPEGRPYYYNSQTGVSQWEKPAEMA